MRKFLHIVVFFILTSNWTIAQNFEALESMLDNELKNTEPGGIILVKKGEEILFQKAVGLADIQTGEAITPNTIFNTGSISKTFVAYGILILEDEGKLSIEDPIINYFPDFIDNELAGTIKVKHLLSHTSGMPDIRNVGGRPSYYLTAKDTQNFEPIKAMTSLNFEPGSQFEYSNPAFNGLALIIEQISEEPWQHFIRKKIFEPALMEQSEITDGAHPKTGVAHAYIHRNGAFEENDYGEYPTFAAAGNGGVWCSILDLIKYEHAIRKSLFLKEDTIEKSREIYVPENWKSNTTPKLGFSWFIGNEYGQKLVSHTGSQGGFRSFYLAIPEKELVFVGLFNRPLDIGDIAKKGLEILQENNWMDKN